MRYRDRDALVRSLREAADFIEERGLELPIDQPYTHMKLTTWLYDDEKSTAREKLRKVALLLGTAEKVFNSSYFDLRRKFGTFTLEFTVNRDAVCKRVVKGMKVQPAVPATPARMVEEVEWVCDEPILLRDGV